MAIEINPFLLDVPPIGGNPIYAINLSTNTSFLNLATVPLTGPVTHLNIDFKASNPHMVLSTGNSTNIPTMRYLDGSDLPSNISMSQITGLEDQLLALVHGLTSTPPYLTTTSNAQGVFNIAANVGQTSSTLAAGNDNRFSANVTGIRKSTGGGATDIAAVAKTDFWNTQLFVASGGTVSAPAPDRRGLVPDPGATAGTLKFLREDGLWSVPPAATGTGGGTVTSVGITMPSEFSVAGSPVTVSGTFAVTKAVQNSNLVFAGPTTGVAAAPTFRAHVYADVSALVGTAASTIAAGNDVRFSASVTGLRKSAGAGSTDVAAIAKTDYWDASNFGPSGVAHAKGLVPDPGATQGIDKFLCEDGLWKIVAAGGVGTITNSMMAQMPANTVKGNPTGALGLPADVAPKIARSSALLNLESITTFADANYTAQATDRYIATSVSLSVTRTITLPLANTFNPSQRITIADDFGGITATAFLNVARQGSDIIQGSSGDVVLDSRYASVTMSSNGSTKWTIVSMSPAIKRKIYSSNATYTTPAGVKSMSIEVVGGGGGGAGAISTGISASACGGGGGAGGYASTVLNGPASSYSITIGAGGSGGAGNANGSAGGSTNFGGLAVATGGQGGVFMTATGSPSFATGGAGGTATTGNNMLASGDAGGYASLFSAGQVFSGAGAASGIIGPAPQGVYADQNGNTAPNGYGSGGSGAASIWNGVSTPRTGGGGKSGVVAITEYY